MQVYQLLNRIKSDCSDHHVRASTALKIWDRALRAYLSVSAESQHYDRLAAAQAESKAGMDFVLGCNCCNNHS